MSEQLSFDVFLSYSSKDTTAVRSFAEGLRAAGLRVWYDEWEIQPGDSIPAKIEEGLERSRILALFMSANAFGSDWSRLESYTFRFRDPLNKERRFIPLRLDAAPIPGSLAQFSYVDCRSDEREKSYATLLARCSPSNVPASTGGATTTVSIGESLKPVSKPSDPHDLSRETNAKVRNTLTIIVPIYNESRAIRDLIKGLKAEGLIGRYRIILCDDGSTDGSFDLIEQYCKGLDNVDCIKNRFNLRKVGAIDRMTRMVHTPFVLTLDADCVLSELQDGALEDLMHTMSGKGYAATCFRILPLGENWLDRLQKLDYLIFTDSLRKILGVPVCLIGQGVLWKTDSFLKVLEMHSGQFHGDDLENTIIALHYKFAIYWERKTIVLMTKPKKTILGLVRQRALSWDFGMYR
ncbi:MAG: TIR domain-containing protein, partial [Candidatus Korobacteraceae bacterium]